MMSPSLRKAIAMWLIVTGTLLLAPAVLGSPDSGDSAAAAATSLWDTLLSILERLVFIDPGEGEDQRVPTSKHGPGPDPDG